MKPAILIAIANDHSSRARFLRELDAEAKNIQKAFAEAGTLCEFLPPLVDATFEEIREQFRKHRNRIAILHFAGHADGLSLFMKANKQSMAQGVRGANLAEFLASQDNLQLVFLNGCSTGPQCEYFTKAGVASVISTNQQINDTVARNLATEFYRSVGRGASIDVSFREAVASSKPNNTDSPRGAYFQTADSSEKHTQGEFTEWPWRLRYAKGAEHAGDWNLPDASGNPLFGAPEIPKSIGFPPAPFKNLKRFERDDARIFFGRGFEIRDLYNKAMDADGPPVILYFGQSGVGKSSLLDSGLKPRLNQNCRVRYQRRTPDGLLESLRIAISSSLSEDNIAEGWAKAERKLHEKYNKDVPLVVILDQVEELFTHPNAKDPHELKRLAELIRAIFVTNQHRPIGKLILSFRKEWLAEITKQLKALRIPFCSVFLDRLGHRGVVEAVHLSAQIRDHFGLTVEEGLGELIATDLLADPASPVAPTLQVMLGGMWKQASSNGTKNGTETDSAQGIHFTKDLYGHATRDGVDLNDFVTKQITELQHQQPDIVNSGLGLSLLNFHTTELGTARNRTELELENAYSDHWRGAQQFLSNCIDRYLLIDASPDEDETADERRYRMAHDTIAPLIRRRFDESDHPGQRARRILDSRIHEWEDGETGDPLDQFDLKTVQDGLAGMPRLNEDELRLVKASEAERERKLKARRRVRVVGMGGMLTIAAIAVVAYLFWQNSQLNNELRIAESKLKMSQEIAEELQTGVFERDQNRNGLKAIHHFARARQIVDQKIADVSLVEPADFAQLESARLASSMVMRNTWLVQAIDLDVASGSMGNTVDHEVALTHVERAPTFVRLDENCERMLVWTTSSRVWNNSDVIQIFDIESGKPLMPQMEMPTLVGAGFNEAGTHFFAMQNQNRGGVDVYTVPPSANEHPADPITIPMEETGDPNRPANRIEAIFRPETHELVILDSDRISVTRDGNIIGRHNIDPNLDLEDIHFESTNQLIASGRVIDDPRKAVFVRFDISNLGGDWSPDITTLECEIDQYGFDQESFDYSYISSDGKSAVYQCRNGDVQLYYTDFDNTTSIKIPEQAVSSFSATMNRIFVARFSETFFDIAEINGNNRLQFPMTNIATGQFSQNGRFLFTNAENGATLWDAVSGEPLTPLLKHAENISDFAIDSRRNRLITCANGGTIRIWQMAEWQPVVSVEPNEELLESPTSLNRDEVTAADVLPVLAGDNAVVGGCFSPSGNLIAVWDIEGAVRIWDADAQLPVSAKMRHNMPFGPQLALSITGVQFILEEQLLVTWTGTPVFDGAGGAHASQGEVRIWNAQTGLPVSKIFFYQTPQDRLLFDRDAWTITTYEPTYDQNNPFRIRLRQLPVLPERMKDVVEFGILATGTRLNGFGDFEYLTAADWHERVEKSPEYLKMIERVADIDIDDGSSGN